MKKALLRNLEKLNDEIIISGLQEEIEKEILSLQEKLDVIEKGAYERGSHEFFFYTEREQNLIKVIEEEMAALQEVYYYMHGWENLLIRKLFFVE